MKMAESAPGHCSEAVHPLARVSGLLVACSSTSTTNQKTININFGGLSAVFETPNTQKRKTLVALHLAIGSSREWVQSAYRRIAPNFAPGPNSFEEFFATGPGTRCVRQDTKSTVTISQDLATGFQWEFDQNS